MSGTTEKDPFVRTVQAWVSQAKGMALRAQQATALDALARVKELTPVDTGNLRANWTIMLPGDVLPVVGQVPDPMEAIRRMKLGDSIVLANPVIYARRIEFGFIGADSRGRHYHQMGRGMMQQTMAELPQIAATATARVMAGQDQDL